MAHKIDSASGSITLISEDGSGNVNLTLPRAGLGTAASADTGTAAGNIPVLDGSGQIASGVLSNAAVADNAITLAKMASGTDGNLITYDASGDPAYVTTGTSGQVLTSGGTGVAPTFQTAAGGGKILQVVTAGSTTASSNISTSWTEAPGSSLSITPTATSSRIYYFYSVGSRVYDIQAIGLKITRSVAGGGESDIRLTNDFGRVYAFTTSTNLAYPYIDTPSYTSGQSIVYKVYAKAGSAGGAFYINESGGSSTNGAFAYAMEIGA